MVKGNETIIFLSGVVIGAIATYLAVKSKYEKIADEEIASVKDFYKKSIEENNSVIEITQTTTLNNPKMAADIAKIKPDLINYNSKYQSDNADGLLGSDFDGDSLNGTHNTNAIINELSGDAVTTNIKEKNGMIPYMITEAEFGDHEDYDTLGFIYYADGVLADENDDPIEDPIATVGKNTLSSFGQKDVVYIRNDDLAYDCEIIKDLNDYANRDRMPNRG